MKIRDLVRRTNVTKETVHYYILEGLLPKPRKRARNLADYDESYVDRIPMIKELQDNYFLPLSVTKNFLKKQKNPRRDNPSPEEFSKRGVLGLQIMGDFFYHLYRKLSRAEYKRILTLMGNGMKGGTRGETESENS